MRAGPSADPEGQAVDPGAHLAVGGEPLADPGGDRPHLLGREAGPQVEHDAEHALAPRVALLDLVGRDVVLVAERRGDARSTKGRRAAGTQWRCWASAQTMLGRSTRVAGPATSTTMTSQPSETAAWPARAGVTGTGRAPGSQAARASCR